MTIRYGSVCSGIEAASVAVEPLGWQPAWFAEIEAFPSAVLAHHWPHVANLGDMTIIADQIRAGELEAPDVLVGGTPCQAFSVAGLRAGLSDHRGQLTLSYVDLANAIDSRRSVLGQQPCVAWWENVPGVLSSKDNAFGCFLAGLAGESDALEPPGGKWADAGCVFGPERAVAWRILDAQYLGLAQRRRRVFVVASARDGFDPAAVLFEFDGVRRDSPPSREARQEIAGTLASRTGAGGFPGTDEACSGYIQPVGKWPAEIASTLNAAFGSKLGLEDQHVNGGCPLFVPSVQVVHGTQDPCTSKTTAFTLGRNNGGENAVIAYAFQQRIARNGRGDMGDVVHALTAQSGETGKGDAAPCVAYAFAENSRAEVRLEGGDGQITGALSTGGGKPGQGNPTIAYGIPGNWIGRAPQNGGNATEPHLNRSPCLTATDRHGVAHAMKVRRLTPRECERLQGFPDDWTAVPFGRAIKPEKLESDYAKYLMRGGVLSFDQCLVAASDGPRYKALGNSMAVTCMRWIGARIDIQLQ